MIRYNFWGYAQMITILHNEDGKGDMIKMTKNAITHQSQYGYQKNSPVRWVQNKYNSVRGASVRSPKWSHLRFSSWFLNYVIIIFILVVQLSDHWYQWSMSSPSQQCTIFQRYWMIPITIHNTPRDSGEVYCLIIEIQQSPPFLVRQRPRPGR